MTRSGRWALNAVLVLLAMAMAVVMAEFGVRILAPQPTGLSYHDRYGLVLHYPGIARRLPQFGTTVSFNSAGMRDIEHSYAKPSGVFRIILLGDSFMEAFQVPFEASMPSLLQVQLAQASGKAVEVINAGVSGWGTDDQLRYLTQYGRQYDPDLIVVAMTLHNDISDNLRQEWHKLGDQVLVERPVEPTPYFRYKLEGAKAYIASRFQLYQLWRRARHGGEIRQARSQLDNHVVSLFKRPPSARMQDGLELTALLLGATDSVASAMGAKMALVLLPLKVQLTDSAYAGFVAAAGEPPDEMPIEAPQHALSGIADSLEIPVVDLLPGFRNWMATSGSPLYLTWDGHWNQAGHLLATSIVAQRLIDAGLVP